MNTKLSRLLVVSLFAFANVYCSSLEKKPAAQLYVSPEGQNAAAAMQYSLLQEIAAQEQQPVDVKEIGEKSVKILPCKNNFTGRTGDLEGSY